MLSDGIVRLTTTRALADGCLAARLGAFHRRHPGIDLELVEVAGLDGHLDIQAGGTVPGLLGHLDDAGHSLIREEGGVNLLHPVETTGDGEGLRIAEGALGAQTQRTNVVIGVGLGAAEVGRVESVDVLFGETRAEVRDPEKGLELVRKVNVERLFRSPYGHVGIISVAGQFADHRLDLMGVESTAQDLERLSVRIDLEGADLIGEPTSDQSRRTTFLKLHVFPSTISIPH